MITLTINTDNDAFQDDPWGEVASILESIATDMREHPNLEDRHSKVYDSNGNTCGTFIIKDE